MIARTAHQIKTAIQSDASLPAPRSLTRGEKGSIVNHINKAVGGDSNRYALLSWLFDSPKQLSTKDLTDDQWWALLTWIDWWCDEIGEWHPRSEFDTEASVCLGETRAAGGHIPDETFKKIMGFLNGSDEI